MAYLIHLNIDENEIFNLNIYINSLGYAKKSKIINRMMMK